MTRLIARLILAMLILPVTGALFVVLFPLLIPFTGSPPSALRLGLLWFLVYGFVGMYWILLWRSAVRWTGRRILLTAVAAGAALVLAVMVGLALVVYVPGGGREVGLLVGGGIVPIAWVAATVLIWRETAAERIERLTAAGRETVCCPLCGYNLTGLAEARCPECGARFTLDQLLAAQPARDEVTLPEE